jgi:hypothetical protein
MIPMRRVHDWDDLKLPGDFVLEPPNEFNKGMIDFVCPNGKQCGVGIRHGAFAGGNGKMKRWGFNGNADQPTLTPSIDCRAPSGCGWHGHIVAGEMKP